NPPRELMDGRESGNIYEELAQLKIEGKIREYGVSLDWAAELETVAATTDSKAAEVMYNAFHQEPAGAFPMAHEKNIGLIIKVPLDSGWLAGKYDRTTVFKDGRHRWPLEVLKRRADLLDKFKAIVPPDTSLTHVALQFILAQPQVSTIIPGGKTVKQALDNFAAADQKLSMEIVQAIYKLWDQEIAHDPLPW
ncbi:MAG: aldo/keto reductase, partial [Desulfobacteraceae bacterium]